MDFIHFTNVIVEDTSTWKGKKILSFDMDWAIDEVINDALDLIEGAGVRATFFVTHNTPVLERMRQSPAIALGLHPNFNPLIDKKEDALHPDQTLSEIKAIVPEARVLRSHSMTHSGRWLEKYEGLGVTHISQYYMPGIKIIQPFKHLNGLVEVPIYFADDGYISDLDHRHQGRLSNREILEKDPDGIKVYNFHPIHIALNSENFKLYHREKPLSRNWEELLKQRNPNFGIRNLFEKLIA